jgi:hypothetical protein
MAVIHKKQNEFLFYNTTCKLFTRLENINSMLSINLESDCLLESHLIALQETHAQNILRYFINP